MAYRDPAVGRARDLERYHRRTAARKAAGLCPRCGKRPPVPERSLCEPCAEKHRISGRISDAKRCARGRKRRRDPEKARANGRRRYRRKTAERLAAGLCPACGKRRPQPERRLCAECAEKKRGRPPALRRGQGVRRPLWRQERRAPPPQRARPEQAALPRTARGGPLRPLRRAPARRRQPLVRRMPCRPQCARARQVGCPACDGVVRIVWRSRAGRRVPLPELRRVAGGPTVAQSLRQEDVRAPQGAQSLHGLRPAFDGRVAVPALRAPLLCPLGRASRSAGVACALHRDRDRHRGVPRQLRQRGRSRRLPGLRQAHARQG